MKLFFVVLACFIMAATFRRKGALYNFDSKATLPLRGLLAIGIILHHLSLTYQFHECINAFRISPIFYFREMGGPIVAIFFLITGYGLSKSLQIKGTSYLSGFLKKRLGKIMPEFLILTALVLLFSVLTGAVSLSEAAHKMATGYPPLLNSWFMYAIVYVYLAFYLSALISTSDCLRTGIVLSLFIALYCGVVIALKWGGWWYISIPAVSVGYFTALYENRITKILSVRYMPVCIGACAVIYALMLGHIPGSRIMAALLFAVLTYVCMRLYSIRTYPILVLLGELSLYIYLVHGEILTATKYIGTNKYLAGAIVILASVVVSMFIKRIRGFIESREFRVYSKNRA